MRHCVDQHEFGRLSGLFEHPDGLDRRRDDVVRSVEQEQRARCDVGNHIIGPEVHHRPSGFRWDFHDGLGGEIFAESLRNWNGVEP